MSRKINSESLEGVHENLERSLCPTKLENLERSVCPTTMLENPQLRWSFIRKVYSIITFQFFLITVAVSIGVFLRSVSNFFIKTTQGFVLYVVLIFVPFLAMYPLYYYYDRKHPLSYLLLLIFNVSSAIPVGLTCAFVSGLKFLEIVIWITAMVFGLTLYTFWAAKRRHDLHTLGSFLFKSFLVFVIYGFIQLLFPLGKFSYMVYECIISIIYCFVIVYQTNHLIKEFTYDQHIRAFISLYLDAIIQFIPLII